MIQVIRYKCCDKIFAACSEPDCYTNRQWLKNLRKDVLEGHRVQMLESRDVKLEKCECEYNQNQLDLFETL